MSFGGSSEIGLKCSGRLVWRQPSEFGCLDEMRQIRMWELGIATLEIRRVTLGEFFLLRECFCTSQLLADRWCSRSLKWSLGLRYSESFVVEAF